MPLQWEKQLTRSDAQVKTQGWPVPYIRLTRSNHLQDTQTWFRNTFFAGVTWSPGHFGDHAIEKAHPTFDITLPGQVTQSRQLMVSHDDSRGQTGNSTPNTWIHWDTATLNELKANSYDGRIITLERSNSGTFSLTIT